MSRTVYADHAATTPMTKRAIDEMTESIINIFGNPSGVHSESQTARAALDDSRRRIAECIGAQKNELRFTSNGSESDNWAILGTAHANKDKGRHIITSNIEHHAVIGACEHLRSQGFEVTFLESDEYGSISTDSLQNSIRKDTILVSVMMANNEVGTIQPIKEMAEISHEAGALFHTDAVQTVGHLPVDVNALGVDLLTMSGHKFGGPKGIGALYARRGVALHPLIHGGGQERGLRGGTENVAGAIAMAAALEDSVSEMEDEQRRLTSLRDRLIRGVLDIEGSMLTGHPERRLPGLASFAFEGIEGESAALMLDYRGIRASTGSACSTGSLKGSHVLTSMGIPSSWSHGSIRFSLGRMNDNDDVDYILEHMPQVVERLRSLPPLCNCGTVKGE